MKKQKYNVAVVGATGAVGAEMINVLEGRNFPVNTLCPLASEKSIGKEISFRGNLIPVDVLQASSFEGIDVALFSAGGAVSKEFAPIAAQAGAVVVDNTSAFRMDPEVPLVVPEVNAEDIAGYVRRGIIANPNCSTIQMVVVLAPLHRRFKITRVVVSTYQAVSGAGIAAMEELSKQAVALFSQKDCEVKVFPHRIAFNCIPHIGKFLEDGSTEEERKMVDETKKIMGDESIRVAATTVRVPVFCSHSEAVNIEFEDPIDPDEARELLSEAPGIEVLDDTNLCKYPMAHDATGKDEVFVGRIRRDASVENGLAMWIVADNLRKGAALNAVQIAEILVREYI
ncbi:MAG: aspartate-semialdehyde dehydrogenase [Pseudomonadota bacterium]